MIVYGNTFYVNDSPNVINKCQENRNKNVISSFHHKDSINPIKKGEVSKVTPIIIKNYFNIDK